MDRNLGNESTAVEGFEEAIQCLEKLKLDSEQASLEQRVAILDHHYSYSHPHACIYCSRLTFIMYLCSASRFLNSCTTSWQISKAWSSPILRMHTLIHIVCLLMFTYGRGVQFHNSLFWLPMEGVDREMAHDLCVFYHHLETFFVAHNV